MRGIFFILLIAICNLSQGQNIGFETIDENKVSDWLPKLTIEYQGIYHFGDSESESTLVLFFAATEVTAQIKSGSWSKDGKWTCKFRNLSNVNIENNKFSSDEYTGNFVFYSEGDKRQKGLKIDNPWSATVNSDNYEIGLRTSYNINEYFPGAYKVASTKLLGESDVNTMHPAELKIMRNEIFARYGYIFLKGGEMGKHFAPQAWYQAQHSDVNDFLTKLEKLNIQTILQEENE